jgi:hypothetical protein
MQPQWQAFVCFSAMTWGGINGLHSTLGGSIEMT